MRVAITGASGLIGSALGAELVRTGHTVLRLVRRERGLGPDDVHWDPIGGRIDARSLEGLDAVVHLAGESIGTERWTREKMEAIRESRVRGTSLLARTLAGLERPPAVLLSASAVGYYGDREPHRPVDEESGPGVGFLAGVAEEWEGATAPAAAAGIRVVHTRFGMVLARERGALPAMLRFFRIGLGGPVGNGRQMWPWIALDDVVPALMHCMVHGALAGPVNFVAPEAVNANGFARALGHALGRPAFLRVPALAARIAFGEMGVELLLSGAKVQPRRLRESGYRFRWPELEPALRHILA